MAQKIKKDDQVIVVSGNDKGKKGKVLKVFPKNLKVLVEKVNLRKKHQRPGGKNPGGIIEKPVPMDISKVMLVCPKCKEVGRVKFDFLKDGSKIRACGKCGESVDKLK